MEWKKQFGSKSAIEKIPKITHRLIEMKRDGYPIVNSIGYFKVMAKEKNWQCKPWTMINIDPLGNIVLPCYTHNEYASSVSIFKTGTKDAVSGLNWKKIESCKKCSLHCNVEPSLVLSRNISSYLNWAFRVCV